MSLNRRHKGVEGTNDRGKADLCGWFNPGGVSQEGSVRVHAKRIRCFVLLSNTAVWQLTREFQGATILLQINPSLGRQPACGDCCLKGAWKALQSPAESAHRCHNL